MAKAKKMGRKIAVFTVLLGVIGGLSWYAYSHKQEVVITVQTEKVTRRSLTETVEATGKLQPVVLVKISPEVSGEIIELPVKEGQDVKKGELLLKIKPDFYLASRNSCEASLRSAMANQDLAVANLDKAKYDFNRSKELFRNRLVSESQQDDAQTALSVAKAQLDNAIHQTEVAKATLARSEDDLSKTTIYSPLSGTISKLNSQLGERVVGTATMAGTEVLSIANLDDMEARVDIGEVDVVLIKPGQKAALEVDSFRDRKFSGVVTEVANTAKTSATGTQQEATKFEVKIRIKENEAFRPGMSVTAKVETRYRTNVLAAPIQSVTTRLPKGAEAKAEAQSTTEKKSNEVVTDAKPGKKKDDANKPVEVVFVTNDAKAKMVPVKRGISDDNYVEITDGLQEGQVIVSGGYKAINRELEDGKLIKVQ